MSDYSELKKLAESATPGPWQAYDTHGKRFVESMKGEAHVVCETPKKQWLKDSELIAAANPSAILALIAENERLALELKDFQWGASVEANAGDEARAETTRLKAENEALRKSLLEWKTAAETREAFLVKFELDYLAAYESALPHLGDGLLKTQVDLAIAAIKQRHSKEAADAGSSKG